MQPAYGKITKKLNDMPIIINLDVVLAKKKVTLTELSKRVSVSLTNLSLIRSNAAKGVRFTTLDEICEALDCQPGDILERVSKEKYRELLGRDADHKLMD